VITFLLGMLAGSGLVLAAIILQGLLLDQYKGDDYEKMARRTKTSMRRKQPSQRRSTLRGMRLRDWLGTPRTVSLRVVDSYRDGSQREHRCPRAGESCSTLGRAYIARYGAVQGWALAFWVVATCGTASYSEEACDGPGRSGGSCCPG
jgi:hypothetical protein